MEDCDGMTTAILGIKVFTGLNINCLQGGKGEKDSKKRNR
jgi:hypothetical protein